VPNYTLPDPFDTRQREEGHRCKNLREKRRPEIWIIQDAGLWAQPRPTGQYEVQVNSTEPKSGREGHRKEVSVFFSGDRADQKDGYSY